MEYRVFDETIVVRLDKGDKIAKCLLEVAKAENVALASVSGIGAVDDFEVGIFDLDKSEYHHIHYVGNHEINALTGNLTTQNGKPYLHVHITCTGRDGKVVGGHLFDGTISLTAEIFLHKVEGSAERRFSPNLNINTISFPQ
ncbi:MAG: DNA-binding protein [Clostridia bacterium]|nr:DNA-binding protein [Clostridia bacterium]